jgi:hypothetical protein
MQLHLCHGLEFPGVPSHAPAELHGLMEACFAAAVESGQAVVALACQPHGLEALERASPDVLPRALGALSLGLTRAFEAEVILVSRNAGHLVVLLVGTDPARVEAACRAWSTRAQELQVEGLERPLRVSLWLGYGVTQPGLRLFVDTLIQVAFEGLRVARFRGPGTCVHTMVYGGVQQTLERERGREGLLIPARTPLRAEAPAGEPPRPEVASVRAEVVGATTNEAPRAEPRREAPASSAMARESAPALLAALAAERRENELLRARLRLHEPEPDSEPSAVTRRPPSAPAEVAQERIELLERRLIKLRRLLAESEERLARAGQVQESDAGVASRYRTVQGLADDAPERERKAGLMESLFLANLELQELLRGRAAS